MADTSNLTNFLEDVADAIREKKGTQDPIAAANFDTEIKNIETGIDTSDATATADDILQGKIAYADNEKLTGNIATEYDYLDTSVSVYNRQIINNSRIAISTPYNILVEYNTTEEKFIFYKISADNSLERLDEYAQTFYRSNVSVGISQILVEDTYLIVWAGGPYQDNDWGRNFCIHFNINTLRIDTDRTAVLEINSPKQYLYHIAINPANPYIVGGLDAGGYVNNPVQVLKYENGAIQTVLTSVDRRPNGCDVEWSSDGKYMILYKGDKKDYQGIYRFYQCDLNTVTLTQLRYTNDEIVKCMYNDKYYITVNAFVDLATNTVIKPLTELTDIEYLWTWKNILLAHGKSENVLKVYIINNDLSLEFVTQISTEGMNMTPLSNSSAWFKLISNGLLYFCDIQEGEYAITSLTIKDKNYLLLPAALNNTTASDVLYNKAFINSDGLQYGTMLDNGELTYTPTTSEQTIPTGYTSGGTISAVTSAIDENITPENIKKDISILGVTGTLESGEDITTYFNTTPSGNHEVLIKKYPDIDCSNLTQFGWSEEFRGVYVPNLLNTFNITSLSNIAASSTLGFSQSELDVTSCMDFYYGFANMSGITSVPSFKNLFKNLDNYASGSDVQMNMAELFNNDIALQNIPQFTITCDLIQLTSAIFMVSNMINNCPNLTEQSITNILTFLKTILDNGGIISDCNTLYGLGLNYQQLTNLTENQLTILSGMSGWTTGLENFNTGINIQNVYNIYNQSQTAMSSFSDFIDVVDSQAPTVPSYEVYITMNYGVQTTYKYNNKSDLITGLSNLRFYDEPGGMHLSISINPIIHDSAYSMVSAEIDLTPGEINNINIGTELNYINVNLTNTYNADLSNFVVDIQQNSINVEWYLLGPTSVAMQNIQNRLASVPYPEDTNYTYKVFAYEDKEWLSVEDVDVVSSGEIGIINLSITIDNIKDIPIQNKPEEISATKVSAILNSASNIVIVFSTDTNDTASSILSTDCVQVFSESGQIALTSYDSYIQEMENKLGYLGNYMTDSAEEISINDVSYCNIIDLSV